MADAIIIAAPGSGSGKTMVTLGLLRALRNAGRRTASAKVGPDYIDPRYHEAASGRPCFNLDPWAMAPGEITALLAATAADADVVIIEGVMGLFDGPDGAPGSSADLAAQLGLPVALIVDCSHQAQSIAALAQGFARHRGNVTVAGVVLNRVASERHELLLRRALMDVNIGVLGAVRRSQTLSLPSRHLGLVQAEEHEGLEHFIEGAAQCITPSLADAVLSAARPLSTLNSGLASLPPLAQRIAIARDKAFGFLYPHFVEGWQNAGAELSFFSPLADEAPDKNADAVYLPGGYPELHAAQLSSQMRFMNSLREAAQRGALIYGECGGFMTLGEALIDAQGGRHRMAGLLPLVTSFAARKLCLGYRQLETNAGPFPPAMRGHEFHHSTIAERGDAPPLFEARDAAGNELGPMGQRIGNVMGSYAHIIAGAA